MTIIESIGTFFYVAIMLLVLLSTLFIVVVAVVYLIFYLFDLVFAKWLYRFVVAIINRSNCDKTKTLNDEKSLFKSIRMKIKNCVVNYMKRVAESIRPRNTYIRYETPLFPFCFSYFAIVLIISVIQIELEWYYAYLCGTIVFLLIYFIGMRRCYNDTNAYENALNNNLDFLKLSFIPLGFVVSIGGLIFTVLENEIYTNDCIQYFTDKVDAIEQMVLKSHSLLIIPTAALIILLMYIISIPVQLLAYLIIHIIKYHRKYGESYCRLFKNWFRVVINYLFCI